MATPTDTSCSDTTLDDTADSLPQKVGIRFDFSSEQALIIIKVFPSQVGFLFDASNSRAYLLVKSLSTFSLSSPRWPCWTRAWSHPLTLHVHCRRPPQACLIRWSLSFRKDKIDVNIFQVTNLDKCMESIDDATCTASYGNMQYNSKSCHYFQLSPSSSGGFLFNSLVVKSWSS